MKSITAIMTALLVDGLPYSRMPSTFAQTFPSTQNVNHHTVVLKDQALPGSDFAQFRHRLRQAIQRRDVDFVLGVMAPNIKLTFGRPFPAKMLRLDDPKALAWQQLERTINTGCAVLDAKTWACPHVFLAADKVRQLDPYEQVFIVGSDVNVRRQPSLASEVITTMTHQVVKFDQDGMRQLEPSQRQALQTWAGWMPISFGDGQRGFVSSRYAYSPLGYRALFRKVNGQWQMQTFIAGD